MKRTKTRLVTLVGGPFSGKKIRVSVSMIETLTFYVRSYSSNPGKYVNDNKYTLNSKTFSWKDA